MPTAAKAFSAIALMGRVRLFVKQLLPDGHNPGRFAQINFAQADAVVAFVTGWRLIGARAGHGTGPAIGQGITAACAGLLHAAGQVAEYALQRRYGNPLAALLDILRIRLDDLQMARHLPIFIALGAGCLTVLAEQLSRVAR